MLQRACLLGFAVVVAAAACDSDAGTSSATGGATAETGSTSSSGPGGASGGGGELPGDLKAISQSCDEDAQCESGFCPAADGLCCESACEAPCMACRADKTGTANGICAPILDGSDPDDECEGTLVCNDAFGCCGDVVPAPGGNCPAACTRCEGTTCVIGCDGFESCRDATLTCPEGFACRVDCSDEKACQKAEVTCPSDYPCELTCGTGNDACRDARLLCGTGLCTLTCNDIESCENAELDCGQDACRAVCIPGIQELPNVHCNEACSCEPC